MLFLRLSFQNHISMRCRVMWNSKMFIESVLNKTCTFPREHVFLHTPVNVECQKNYPNYSLELFQCCLFSIVSTNTLLGSVQVSLRTLFISCPSMGLCDSVLKLSYMIYIYRHSYIFCTKVYTTFFRSFYLDRQGATVTIRKKRINCNSTRKTNCCI